MNYILKKKLTLIKAIPGPDKSYV